MSDELPIEEREGPLCTSKRLGLQGLHDVQLFLVPGYHVSKVGPESDTPIYYDAENLREGTYWDCGIKKSILSRQRIFSVVVSNQGIG